MSEDWFDRYKGPVAEDSLRPYVLRHSHSLTALDATARRPYPLRLDGRARSGQLARLAEASKVRRNVVGLL